MLFTEFNFYKMSFPTPASPLMYGIIELHDHIFFFLNIILFIVLFLIATTVNLFMYIENSKLNKYLLSENVKNKYDWLRLNHGTTIEIIWTIIPSIILVLIAIPSFALLYATDELVDPAVTIQVIGHQWYWSYEYNDLTVSINVASNKMNSATFFLEEEFNKKTELGKFINRCMYLASTITDEEDNYLFLYTRTLYGLFTPNFSDYDSIFEQYIKLFPEIDPKKWKLLGKALLVLDSNTEVKNLHGSFEFDSYLKSEDDLNIGEQRLYETDFPLVLPKNTHIRFMITADDVIHSWSVPALGIKVDAVPGRINHAHTFIKRSGIFYGQCSELCGVNHAFMPIQIIAFEPNMYYNYLRLILLSK